MLGEPWPYWAVFALAALAWFAVPLAAWLERRAMERDKALWEEMWR